MGKIESNDFALSILIIEQEKIREQIEEANEKSEAIQFELSSLEGKDAELSEAIKTLKGSNEKSSKKES